MHYDTYDATLNTHEKWTNGATQTRRHNTVVSCALRTASHTHCQVLTQPEHNLTTTTVEHSLTTQHETSYLVI